MVVARPVFFSFLLFCLRSVLTEETDVLGVCLLDLLRFAYPASRSFHGHWQEHAVCDRAQPHPEFAERFARYIGMEHALFFGGLGLWWSSHKTFLTLESRVHSES